MAAVRPVRVDQVEEQTSREEMMEVLATQEDVLRAYRGEWVALAGHDVVAHAPAFSGGHAAG